MLSEKDKQFIVYWEQERDRLNNTTVKLLSGLPMAILFCVPILLFITSVYLFFPDWYTKVSNNMAGSMVAIVVAVIICVFFFSYFRMHYKWESNEQLYQELKRKQQQEEKSSQ